MDIRLRAGTVLRVGLGGFVDGIVLHQIVQCHKWDRRSAASHDGYDELDIMWDGLFHGVPRFIRLIAVSGLCSGQKSVALEQVEDGRSL